MNEEAMRQAIQLARTGYKIEASQIFKQVVRVDPQNDLAWAWLAAITSEPEQKRQYLKRAVETNPDNVKAQRALDELDFMLESPLGGLTGSSSPSTAYASPAIPAYSPAYPAPAAAPTALPAAPPAAAPTARPVKPTSRNKNRDLLEDSRSGGTISPWVWVFGGLVGLCMLCMLIFAVVWNFGRKAVTSEFQADATLGPGQHTIIYRVEGAAGSADVTYARADGQSVQKTVSLPWAVQFKAYQGAFLSVMAVGSQDAGSVSCVIEGDGLVLAKDTSSAGLAMAICTAILQ